MALTLRRFFEPKATITYPEDRRDVAAQVPRPAPAALRRVRHAQVRDLLPVRPGLPDRVHRHGRHRHAGRFHVHWGAPETYGERREESALRRSGRPVPDPAYAPFAADRPRRRSTRSSRTTTTTRPACSQILEATQAAYGYLPVAALKRISQRDRRLVRDDLRHGQLLRATCASSRRRPTRPGRRRSTARRPAEATYLAALERLARRAGAATAERRGAAGAELMVDLLHDAAGLAGDPARARRRQPIRPISTPPSAAGAFDGLRAADPRPGRDRRRSPRSPRPGLRGRGGAGFPTGDKWRLAAGDRRPPRRYVVANGYGADPAAGTDRYLMERDPYAVVEGAAIAAFAIGASEAIIAVRAEATETIRRLEAAIAAAEEAGFLGFDVLGSGHDLDVTVRPVQGAYMLGEETVLLKALEGKRGQPEQRPPHPAERGLHGMPTVVHNVQTLAAVPVDRPQRRRGVRGDRRRRTAPGTILVQVRDAGRRRDRGGPARDAAARRSSRSAARCRAGRTIKAVLVGGPSGGLLPPDLLDTPVRLRGAPRGRRPRRLGLGRRRRRPGLRRRPRPAPDPLLRRARRAARRSRAGSAPGGWPRSPTASSTGRPRPTDLDPAGRPVAPTSSAPRCATTSGWRPSRSRAGCDTSGPSSTSTSSAAPARPASATRSRWPPVRPIRRPWLT